MEVKTFTKQQLTYRKCTKKFGRIRYQNELQSQFIEEETYNTSDKIRFYSENLTLNKMQNRVPSEN